jgi:hypothetical protein
MNEEISLSHGQIHAIAERAARLRRLARQSRGYGVKGDERIVLAYENPYNDPALHGLYMRIEGRQGAFVPLFAKDLGQERNFDASRLPARDQDGHVFHPDMEGIGDDEFDMSPQLRALGWHCTTVSFESDASQEQRDRYSDGNSPDCSYWTPRTPRGKGWLLAAIYDTEDGPVALYVRPAIEPVAAERYAEMADMVHDHLVTMQAAWIEWKRGGGAEAAMQWIENTLVGPGLIPKEDEPWASEAQTYHDANRTEPFPFCFCGRPSNTLAGGKGFCSDAHYKQAKAESEGNAGVRGINSGSPTQSPKE